MRRVDGGGVGWEYVYNDEDARLKAALRELRATQEALSAANDAAQIAAIARAKVDEDHAIEIKTYQEAVRALLREVLKPRAAPAAPAALAALAENDFSGLFDE